MNLEELYAKLDSDDAAERKQAAQSLAQMGDDGARVLARALQEYPWLPAPKPRSMWANPSADEPRDGPGPQRRKSRNVTAALASIGRPAMKLIAMLLRDPRLNTRMNALMTLYYMDIFEARMAPHAGAAAEALVDWLREADPQTCEDILSRIKYIGYKTRRIAPALVSLYHSYPPEQADIRLTIANTITAIDPPADAIEDVVWDILEQGNEEQTKSFLWTMGQRSLHAHLACVLPALERRVRQFAPSSDTTENSRAESAADLIGKIGPPAQETLLRLVNDENDAIARCAVKGMEEFARKSNPEPFYEILLSRLSRRDPLMNCNLDEDEIFSEARHHDCLPPEIEARWKATRVALDAYYAAEREKNKKPKPNESDLPGLLSRLSSPESWNDEEVVDSIRAIFELGPKAHSAAPLLMRIAEETRNGLIMCAAKAALAQIARDAVTRA